METWILIITLFTIDGKFVDLETIDDFKSEQSCVAFSDKNFNANTLSNKIVAKKSCVLKHVKQQNFKPHPLLRANKTS